MPRMAESELISHNWTLEQAERTKDQGYVEDYLGYPKAVWGLPFSSLLRWR